LLGPAAYAVRNLAGTGRRHHAEPREGIAAFGMLYLAVSRG